MHIHSPAFFQDLLLTSWPSTKAGIDSAPCPAVITLRALQHLQPLPPAFNCCPSSSTSEPVCGSLAAWMGRNKSLTMETCRNPEVMLSVPPSPQHPTTALNDACCQDALPSLCLPPAMTTCPADTEAAERCNL